MTLAQMIAAVRRDIREPSAITVSDSQIEEILDLGAERVWEALVRADGTLGRTRESLQSDTHVFTIPSSVLILNDVWDMGTNASVITGATNTSPIVITSAGHPFAEGDSVLVHGCVGNSAANGMFEVDDPLTDSFELKNTTGTGSWTSGGLAFKEKSSFIKMIEKNPDEMSGTGRFDYILRHGQIVVDYPSFSNDLIIDFIRVCEGHEDVPGRYHIFLVSFAVMNTMRFPEKKDINYDDLKSMLDYHSNRFQTFMESLSNLQKQTSSPKRIKDSINWGLLY